MQLENRFSVSASVDDTFAAMMDVPRVARCLPGASAEPSDQEGVYDGRMKVKLGPMSVAYTGTLRLEETDRDAHRAVMRIDAKEVKGQGGASARMETNLSETATGTDVVVVTDLDISGRAAQLGHGVMENVSERMMAQFARRLEEDLGSAGAAATAAPATPEPAAAPTAAAASGAKSEPPAPESARPAPPPPPPAGGDDDALDLGGMLGLDTRTSLVLGGGIGLALLWLLRRPRTGKITYRAGLFGPRVKIRWPQ